MKLEADIEQNIKAIKAVETELAALGKKLAPLEEKEELKTLDNDDRSRLAALREDKKQLRDKEKQLRDKELKLMDERAEKRAKKVKPPLVPLAARLTEMGRHMVAPLGVGRPVVPLHPPFCAEEGWLDKLATCVGVGLDQSDGIGQDEKIIDRVAPLALIRCSRGGKTRTLYELAKVFHELRPGVAVIFVSFNNDTSIADWELEDPVGALCRRIAFAALDIESPASEDWKRFANTYVTSEDVIAWLGKTPCLLLIDELNLLHCGKEVAGFLKDHFLSTMGRYFVFSSHVVPASELLSKFLDNTSLRKVLIWGLPLVETMADAQVKLGWPAITVREVLARGRLPGLIVVTRLDPAGGPPIVYATRNAVLSSVFEKWNDKSAKYLLDSFLTGQTEGVLEPLLQFMNASETGCIIWVPFHMEHVLSSCAASRELSAPIRMAVRAIADVMHDFERGKTAGGDTWEALFVVALLIRLVTGKIDLLFPRHVGLESYGISYNTLWDPTKKAFECAANLSDLIAGVVMPAKFPHFAVYYPPLANFALYDVVIVWYDATGNPTYYGYQLKEGKAMPRPKADQRCRMSCVARGAAAAGDSSLRGWAVLGRDSVDDILGVTGKSLAPEAWRELKD